MASSMDSCLQLVVAVVFLLVFSVKSLKPNELRPSSIIKKVNAGGPYIGLISVYSREEDAFFSTGGFKPNPKHPYVDLSGKSTASNLFLEFHR